MKPDEVWFLLELAKRRPRQLANGPYATDISTELGIHPKRALYILRKWEGKGWWESGVSERSGFLTDKGKEMVRRLGGA